MSLLDRVSTPLDVKMLGEVQLPELAEELRREIIDDVSKNGGHLASNLGVVEIVIALLRIFSPPEDKIIFDVSHQSYAYKILTGRRKAMTELRRTGGASGFMKRTESDFDVFGAGHAGTAISAALGFAAARDAAGGNEAVVALVGDGALCNGVSLEALNNVTQTTKRLIIVLNDNRMSISKNVGALSKAFGRLMVSRRYNRWKTSAEEFGIKRLRMSWLRRHYLRVLMHLKSFFVHSSVVESLGLRYIGPVDGHNIKHLISAFEVANFTQTPVLVHVSTVKGKGYPPAENNPSAWHGSNPFEISTGEPLNHVSGGLSWSEAFGRIMCAEARRNSTVAAITAGMTDGTGLVSFAQENASRFFDVGICEGHQMTFAAGLAAGGMRPVVAVYSTFFQRSIDNFIHDAALQKLPVTVCLDRAGAVPGDGPTHHGIFDLAMLASVPGITVMQPRTPDDLAFMVHTALSLPYPAVIRYPRGRAGVFDVCDPESGIGIRDIPIGKAKVLADNSKLFPGAPVVSLWALGQMFSIAGKTAKVLEESGINFILVDAVFVKPLDTELVEEQIASGVSVFVTLEDAVAVGGFGSVLDAAVKNRAAVVRVGWPDDFIPHASSMDDLFKMYGIEPDKIASRAKEALMERSVVLCSHISL